MTSYKDTLAAFLDKEENTESVLAEKVGRSQAAINRYRRGVRFPDAETARLIEQHTAGAVPFAVWQSDFLERAGIAA
jgi:transcriptional regulator with XRE-family HTH domain